MINNMLKTWYKFHISVVKLYKKLKCLRIQHARITK